MAGSHLADFLLEKTDWEIGGLCRWRSPLGNIAHLLPQINRKERIRLLLQFEQIFLNSKPKAHVLSCVPKETSGSMYRRNGFTLIELSIALVIIGLIVGGVLVGRDLITAAAIRAQLTQLEKYNQAVNTFNGKYGGLPGDLQVSLATTLGFTTVNCSAVGMRDGNGLIDGNSGHPLIQAVGETGLFWQDLSTVNLIDGTYPNGGAAAVACGGASPVLPQTMIGQYLPGAKLGNGNYVYVYETNGANWFGLSTVTSVNASGQLYSSSAIPVIQAYRMDAKVDDGMAQTGRVQAAYLNGGYLAGATTLAPNANPDTTATCYNSSTGAYSVAINNGNSATCALSFRFQ